MSDNHDPLGELRKSIKATREALPYPLLDVPESPEDMQSQREAVATTLWESIAALLNSGRYSETKEVLKDVEADQEKQDALMKHLDSRHNGLIMGFMLAEELIEKHGTETTGWDLIRAYQPEHVPKSLEGWTIWQSGQAWVDEDGKDHGRIDTISFHPSEMWAPGSYSKEAAILRLHDSGTVKQEIDLRRLQMDVARKRFLAAQRSDQFLRFRLALVSAALWEFRTFGEVTPWAPPSAEERQINENRFHITLADFIRVSPKAHWLPYSRSVYNANAEAEEQGLLPDERLQHVRDRLDEQHGASIRERKGVDLDNLELRHIKDAVERAVQEYYLPSGKPKREI
jgi:hypothetical protein